MYTVGVQVFGFRLTLCVFFGLVCRVQCVLFVVLVCGVQLFWFGVFHSFWCLAVDAEGVGRPCQVPLRNLLPGLGSGVGCAFGSDRKRVSISNRSAMQLTAQILDCY